MAESSVLKFFKLLLLVRLQHDNLELLQLSLSVLSCLHPSSPQLNPWVRGCTTGLRHAGRKEADRIWSRAGAGSCLRNSGIIEDNIRSWAWLVKRILVKWSLRLEECISPCLPFSALWGVLEWQSSLAPLQGSLCQSQTEWFIFISNKTFVLIHLLCYHTFIWKYFLSFLSQ